MIKAADVDDLEATFARLRTLIPLTEEEIESARTEIRRSNPTTSVTVADRLSWEDVAEIAVNAPALPGVSPEVGLSRLYPSYGDFAHGWAMLARSVTTISNRPATLIPCC